MGEMSLDTHYGLLHVSIFSSSAALAADDWLALDLVAEKGNTHTETTKVEHHLRSDPNIHITGRHLRQKTGFDCSHIKMQSSMVSYHNQDLDSR